MEKVDWKRKLSSRKFWVALLGFVTAIAAAFGLPEASVERIVSIITAGATLIVYILAEGWVDAQNAGGDNNAAEVTPDGVDGNG